MARISSLFFYSQAVSLHVVAERTDYLLIKVTFLRVISSHSGEALKTTLGVLGRLFLLSLVHDEWGTELRCRIMSCSAGVRVVWPVGWIWLSACFCKFYRNTATAIHLHIVYACFQATTAELNNCDRDIYCLVLYRKKFAKPCSRGMCVSSLSSKLPGFLFSHLYNDGCRLDDP